MQHSPLVPFLLVGALAAQNAPPPPVPKADPAPAATEGAPDALAATRIRLRAALQKTAARHDTAFTAAWGPQGKKANDPMQALLRHRGAEGKASGSWHQDRLQVAIENANEDQLLLAGRQLLAKDNTRPWCRRQGRFADGNPLGFVPEPALLLSLLAGMDLAVTQRNAGALEDRPVEIVSVTLNADQAAELVFAGAVPDALASGMTAMMRLPQGLNAGPRLPPPSPGGTVDLAIHLDPGTQLIHQVVCRGWTPQRGGAGNVIIAQGAAVNVQVLGANAEEAEPEPAEEAAAGAPLQYEDGLPKRSSRKMSVLDYTLRLQEHGARPAPALSDAERVLLGK
jgi:hypothetical protein